jgi:hypothetical protein
MDWVKRPALKPALDRSAADSGRNKLPPLHNPVLPIGQVRDRTIARSRAPFPTYTVVNGALAGHAVDPAERRRACGAHFAPTPSRGSQKRPQPAVAASGFDPFK